MILGTKIFTQTRSMATLKEVSLRLKSVQSIGKITKSMKMIASTKVAKAQRAMGQARIYGNASLSLLTHTQTDNLEMKAPLLICCSSDRGLCGGIHSYLAKYAKKTLTAKPDAQVAVLGVKARSKLQYDYSKQIAISFDGVCKFPPSYYESSLIAENILAQLGQADVKNGPKPDGVEIVYNRFKSVIAFETTSIKIPNIEQIQASPKLAAYEIEDSVLENYREFILANTIYSCLADGFAAEVSSRRTAMENATKNADEMVKKLTLTYNRSRQAVITNDLCDIITGASALE